MCLQLFEHIQIASEMLKSIVLDHFRDGVSLLCTSEEWEEK